MSKGKIVFYSISGLVALFVLGWTLYAYSVASTLVVKSTDPDKIISNYEEFQEIYNTTQKLDADLKTICLTASNDAMFAQFSKSAMIAQKRQSMTRWVNEYNAKSKMITREYWKSPSLPYQLREEDFPNYNCNNGRQAPIVP